MTSPPARPTASPPPERRAATERRASGQMPLPQPPRLGMMRGLGLYAALFGGVLMLLLVAVILEDMALRDSLLVHAQSDAAAVAAEVEGAVALRIAAARGFQGMYADGAAPAGADAAARFRRLVPLVASGAAPLFHRVVVRDVATSSVHDTVLTLPMQPAEPADSGIVDPVAAELAMLATRDTAAATAHPSQPHALPLASDPAMLAIVVPLLSDSVVAGTFVGAVRVASLASQAIAVGAVRRRRFVVAAGGDTLLSHGEDGEGSTRVATTTAQVRAATPWVVHVIHEDTAPGVRATLWLLGSTAVLFLLLGLARERRQADRVAERSAELERLSTELLRSNRMKSEFLANVSHELRTPLNAIVGFVELLRDGVYGELSPRQTNPVERIAGSATHLRHLVDQVLDIAKMAAGRLEVHLESVVLRPFVLNVASELESLAADKGIVLSLTVGSSLPRVRTDPSHLRQILVNLVGNAIKYTPTGGAVAIRTRLVGVPGAVLRGGTPAAGSMALPADASGLAPRPVDDEPAPPTLAARSPDPARPWVTVQVSDTGIGIAPADHDRIFEEFEQVNAGPRGESMERGTGLGLPISRRLARLLGGDVSVDSGLGRGATFTLWLPLDVVPPGEQRR
jgi:signal transduction histidine kinase